MNGEILIIMVVSFLGGAFASTVLFFGQAKVKAWKRTSKMNLISKLIDKLDTRLEGIEAEFTDGRLN